jgi:hypothetical protein
MAHQADRPAYQTNTVEQPSKTGLLTNLSAEKPSEVGLPTNLPAEQPSKAGLPINLPAGQPSEAGLPTNLPADQPSKTTVGSQANTSTKRKSWPSTIEPRRHDGTSPSHVQTVEEVPKGLYQARRRIRILADQWYRTTLAAGTSASGSIQ